MALRKVDFIMAQNQISENVTYQTLEKNFSR
jgi:hypothetical protein